MNGKNHRHVVSLQNCQQSVDDVVNALAEVLSPVTRHQNDPPIAVLLPNAFPARGHSRVRLDHRFRGDECVDHSIAGDMDPFLWNVLGLERLGGTVRRGKVLVCDGADDLPVHFLRPWRIDIAAS